MMLVAQVERVLPRRSSSSLEGTSFVVGFMANDILEEGGDPRVEIYISSQFDAKVTISSGVIGSYDVFVAANTVRRETVIPFHVVNVSERAYKRGVFVESDVPVVVYTLSTFSYSTDTYTAIPIRHLGTSYYTVNRPTDWYNPRVPPDPKNAIPRVGEFMIIATEDNTLVDITPTVETRAGKPAGVSHQIMLSRGDCYLVQAKPTRFGGDDLSGSHVSSNVPIALLSGHMRSSIPLDSVYSKDHLVEQLPPVNLWGRSYATARFASSPNPDVFRIMASTPFQRIDLVTAGDTTQFFMAKPGDWLDTALIEPAYWTSSEPFFLVQFMASTGPDEVYADPAMVVIPPIEQYVSSSLFQFPRMVVSNVWSEHRYFVNVIAERRAINSLKIDTTYVMNITPEIATQRIPGTTLHWSALALAAGSHTMSADTGNFACVMYGITAADSYANMVGVAYEPPPSDDRNPPKYSFLNDCGVISGTISDVSIDTVELTEVQVITPRTFNYRWQVSQPLDSTGVVEFDADVRDLWKDAQIVIHSYDRDGNGREYLYKYDAPNVGVPKEVVIKVDVVEVCTTAVLYNKDSTPVHIVGIRIAGDRRITLGPGQDLDTVLAAGDSLSVVVCLTPTKDTTSATSWIIIEYPCKLIRQIIVRSVKDQSVSAGSIDFGNVRVGDTACGRVPIVNDGKLPVDVRSLISAQMSRGFSVNLTALALPRILNPGDTIWVEVCFTPDSLGSYTRVDTVHSTPEFGALTTYTGRGVRPRLASVVVDWGPRRLGTRNDTSIVLKNTGDGWCAAQVPVATIDTAAFSIQGAIVAGIRLDPADSVIVTLSFIPVERGFLERNLPVDIDWRLHQPVEITLRGIGTMPDVVVQDIDMGNVVVDSTRDSIVGLLETGSRNGNEPLAIFAVRLTGPDATSFQVPTALLALNGLGAIDSLVGQVSFTPRRIGRHECRVEIDHDAMPAGARTTSAFLISGNGIQPRNANIRLNLDVAAIVSACTNVPVTVTVSNTGDGPMRIDTLVLEGADSIYNLLPSGLRFVLEAFSTMRIDTTMQFDRNSSTSVKVRMVDSTGEVQLASSVVVTEIPSGAVAISVNAPAPYLTGPVSLNILATMAAGQDDTTQPEIVITVDDDRFLVDTTLNIVARITDADVSDASVPVDVLLTPTSAVCRPRMLTRGAWTLDLNIPGIFLWKDPMPFPIRAQLGETRCFDGSPVAVAQVQVAPCGAVERVVRLGAIPQLGVNVLRQPTSDVIGIELIASHDMDVLVECESLGGQRFVLSEQFSLQKGIRHCNFSCSGWASGIYRLIFRHGIGVTDRLIIIVN